MAKRKLSDMTMDYTDIAAEMFEDGVELDTEVSLRVKANVTLHKMRRIKSEIAVEEELPWHWEQGVSYHCISNGDVDGLTYLRAAVKQQRCRYVMLATWSLAAEDIREMRHWVKSGYIGRIDVYVGEMFLSAGRRIGKIRKRNAGLHSNFDKSTICLGLGHRAFGKSQKRPFAHRHFGRRNFKRRFWRENRFVLRSK